MTDEQNTGQPPAEEAPPKQPWEENPIPPEHEPVADDPDVDAISKLLDEASVEADRFAGDVTVRVPADRIADVCRMLKHDRGFTLLVDLTAVDWPEREAGRFDLVYWLHRFDDERRIRLVTALAEGVEAPSVTGVWRTADWLEREVFDMFGIRFDGHPRLERILTWEGFNGHPLRKDFPVEGIDTGAAVQPDVYPPGGGPEGGEETEA